MILHIPHATRLIPEEYRDQFLLSDAELLAELLVMTDAFTEELFSHPEATTVLFPASRLLVDVERFEDDAQEPMSSVGMGMIYTHTAHGRLLRRSLRPGERAKLVAEYYRPHHERLHRAVEQELAGCGAALIVDCHSFPSQPLPCDADQSVPRPDLCIGTDRFHTPKPLVELTARSLKDSGLTVGINRPYSGALVPTAYYRKDRRLSSIMIEVNRSLYLDESSGVKTVGFDRLRRRMSWLLDDLDGYR